MVAPIRELENITFNTFTLCATMNKIASEKDVAIGDDSFDLFFNNTCDNYDEVHGCSLTYSAHSPRTLSMSLSKCKKSYAERMERQNDRMNENKPVILTNSTTVLEYMTLGSQKDQVSKTANNINAVCQQYVSNEALALNQPARNNMVNVQLSYNINQALDSEFWDGDFHAISLHGSIEHLVSDIKIIKDSLSRMRKYILGKSINEDKANKVQDLEGVSKAAWEFLLAIYKFRWDSLFVDESKTIFRNKVKSKFGPQIIRP